ncbi:MAG: hypothetical protein GTO18_04820 [Anaerolineales bacterium]|nr:hypothetical protein [Anaerolineales bacterium]
METKKEWSLTPLIRVLAVVLVVGAVGLGLMAFTTDPLPESNTLVAQDEGDEPDKPFFGRGGPRGHRGFGGRGWFGPGSDIDYDAFLASALGITVEELQAAYEEADAAALEEAIAKGYITEEQAELMRARTALMEYINKDELIAGALGMTVEEFRDSREAGKSLSELLDEKGLDAADVREAMKAAHEEAVQDAVRDGVITQEQADEILSGEFGGPLFGGRRGFGGRGEFFGPGGPCRPETNSDEGTSL